MAADNPFELLAQAGQPATPPTSPAPEAENAPNPFEDIAAGKQEAAPKPSVPVPPDPTDINPFSKIADSAATPIGLLSPEERKQSDPNTDPTTHTDEPWYSRTWAWMNQPLYDAHQWGVRTGAGPIERGFESGVEDVINGLDTPFSIGITAATLGGSSAARLGVAGLQALGVSAEAAPVIAHGIKAMIDLGFTGQQIHQVMTQSPQILDALKDGDYETAARLTTEVLPGAALTALGTRQTFEDAKFVKDVIAGKTPQLAETLKTAKAIAGDRDVNRRIASEHGSDFHKNITTRLAAAGATDEITQGAIRKWMVNNGDLNMIKNQHDALAGTLRATTPPEVTAGGEFKQWLGKSKMVDETGKPIVAYHGTMSPEPIRSFETGPRFTEEGETRVSGSGDPNSLLGPHFAYGKGAQEVANKFATGEGVAWLKQRKAAMGEEAAPSVYPVHLKIEKPKDFGSEANLNNFINQGKITNEELLNKAMESDDIEDPHEGGEAVDKWMEKYDNDPAFRQSQNKYMMMLRESDLGYDDYDSFQSVMHEAADELASDARKRLQDAGFDGVLYNNDVEGGKSVVPIVNAEKQVRFAIPAAAGQKAWNQDYVYHATDVSRADMIRNAGIGKRGGKGSWYSSTPEEAMRSGVTPVSGKREDLRVFAVPRSEAEAGKGEPPTSDLGTGLAKKGDLFSTGKPIMPSHEVVLDDQGRPTGQVVPLRGNAPLTLENSRFQDQYTPAEKDKLLSIYKKALTLTPEQMEIGKSLRKFYDGMFNKAHENGIIRQAVENYHPQAWAKDRPNVVESLFGIKIDPTDNSAYSKLRHQTDNGSFDTNVAAAKHRAFETEFQGEMAGYKTATWDLAKHASDYQMRLEKALADRKFLEALRASGAKASDGRPLVALAGTGRVVGEESGNPALLVNPGAIRGQAISGDIIKALQDRGELKGLIDSNKIEQLPFTREATDPATGEKVNVPAFAWSPEGYHDINHPSMKGWQYIANDTAGNPAIMKANMRIHPEAAEYIRQVVGADVSRFKQSPWLRAIMNVSREAKHSLLAFSPFHAVQEGLRAVMVGINPFDWSPVHVENDPVLTLGVKNGLTFPDFRAEDAFSEGVSSAGGRLVGSIPGLGKVQEYINDFTFNKYIPNLKARAFKSVVERFRDRMPGAGANEVAAQAASYVNDVFGGQNWRNLGLGSNAQDALRAVALAPDWLVSEARMLYRAAGGMGSPAAGVARTDIIRLGIGLFVAARAMNMLATGNPHPEAPFGLVIPGGKGEEQKVYSLRTLPTDLMHALTDPQQFVRGRLNPLIVRTPLELIQGRDELGRKLSPGEEVRDLASNVVPIGVQNILKGKVPGGLNNTDQLIKSAGATVYRYRTEAEKLAQEKASDRMPSGPLDPSQLAAHRKKLQAEDLLRNGDLSQGAVRREFPAREAQDIITQSRMTPLQARVTRLPLADALDVWEISTPKEKDELHSLLWKKRVAYIQAHPPRERENDPTWIKAQKVFGDLHRQPATESENPFSSIAQNR